MRMVWLLCVLGHLKHWASLSHFGWSSRHFSAHCALMTTRLPHNWLLYQWVWLLCVLVHLLQWTYFSHTSKLSSYFHQAKNWWQSAPNNWPLNQWWLLCASEHLRQHSRLLFWDCLRYTLGQFHENIMILMWPYMSPLWAVKLA